MVSSITPSNLFSRLQLIPDYEMRGPLPYTRSATQIILISLLSGALLALVMHALFGVAPAWVAIILLSVVTVCLVAVRWWQGHRVNSRSNNPLIAPDQDSINLLQLLYEHAPALLGIFELHENDIFHIYDNPTACRFFGVLPGSTWGKLSSELGAPTNLVQLWVTQCRECKARSAPVRFEFQDDKVRGGRWFSATICPLPASARGTPRFGYVAEDISDLKRTETSLLDTRERLSSALESGALATWDWDIKNDLLYGDATLVRLFGLPPESIRGVRAQDFIEKIYIDDRECVKTKIREALEQEDRLHIQYRITPTDGRPRWVSVSGKVIRDATNTPIRFLGATVEITSLKEAEEALRRTSQSAEERLNELESIYTYTPIGLCVFDLTLRWLRINKVMADFFGRPPEELVGHPIQELAPTLAQSFEPAIRKVIETKSSVLDLEASGEAPLIPGTIRTWRANLHPLLNRSGEVFGVNVVSEDITERRRASEEHAAYRTLLGLVVTDASLDATLDALASSVEKIFPTSFCYLVRDHERGDTVTPILRPELPILRELFSPSLSPDDTEIFTTVIAERREVLIPDVTRSSPTPFTTRLIAAGVRSCWIRPIILSNGLVWGACAVHHKTIALAPTTTDREHLDVLLRLAATVIERSNFLSQLTSTRERLELAEQAGQIGVFDWDPKTGKVIWTSQMEDLFGLAPGSFEGTCDAWSQRIHVDDLAQFNQELERIIAHHESTFLFENRYQHANGSTKWMHIQGGLTYDASGEAIRIVGTARDITDRKRAEEESRVYQERLDLALEAGSLGFWDWHIPSGHCIYGGCWAPMLGYTLDDVPPHISSWQKLVHPDDMPTVQKLLEQHFAGITPEYVAEYRLKKKDGSWRWSFARGRVVERDDQGKPLRLTGILSDTSEQHEAREALKTAAKKKDEFLATLAHELRNPLAPLRTGLQILKANPSSNQSIQVREMMERQLLHMVRLIDDLLDVSRITRGQLELRREHVTLRSVVETALEASLPSLSAGEHTLTTHLPEGEVPIYCDPTRLSQVVSNLLVNSAKYTPNHGMIDLSAHVESNNVIIAIRDNGLGLPADMLDQVFEMFGQVNQTLDRAQGGLGIGLALVRKLVEMHGGKAWAESPGVGKGSTFTIRLPIIEQNPQLLGDKNHDASTGDTNHMKKILVVDDNIDGAASLALYLEMLGHTVTVVHNGSAALDAVRASMPEVVFLDIGLPGISGYDVARSIREMPHGKDPLLIAVTGWGTEEDKRRSAESGCNTHLTKPIDLSEAERLLA